MNETEVKTEDLVELEETINPEGETVKILANGIKITPEQKEGNVESKTGRPTVFTPEVLQKLEYAFAMGCTDNEACLYADIAPSSLYNYQKENPDFLERKDQLKDKPMLKARSNIVEALEAKNLSVSTWYAERKRKSEFAARTEQTGAEGKDLIPDSLKPEEKTALLGLLNK